MRRPLLLMLLAAGSFLGCSGNQTQQAELSESCGSAVDGKLLLTWTLNGQPATAAGCAGVDHLDLVLAPDLCNGSIEISPIPCERDAAPWRYDQLPRGGAVVEIRAVDASDRTVAQGYTRVTIGPDLPATPTTVPLK